MKTFFIILGLFQLEISSAQDPIRLKNFREIYASYESVTRVDGKDGTLQEIFRLSKERLPRNGTADELNSPAVLAMTELSGAFCKKAIDREKILTKGERILFLDIDFELGPIQFSDYLVERISNHLSRLFWNRDINPQEATVMVKLVSEAGAANQYSKIETENVLHILCTTYATSLAFLVK
ncbi:MAG: hypothetical protein SGJ18_02590 [Pseudomonadota bacterium]|nr:hypothetical protein [Pseudomonadota bacterium]